MRPIIKSRPVVKIVTRIFFSVFFILLGLTVMLALGSMKKPPARIQSKETPLKVSALKVKTEDVPVVITGYGEAVPLHSVTLAPEVSGKIVALSPGLGIGETVNKGELLFQIDNRNYLAAEQEYSSKVGEYREIIRRLKKQLSMDRDRLTTMRRNQELARGEYERYRRLFVDNNVGSRSKMERAEQAANSARERADQLAGSIKLIPIQIEESKCRLGASMARLGEARANLGRCRVSAPFTGRVKEANVDLGEYVTAGKPLIVLADDSILEIRVPLDSRECRSWLPFSPDGPNEKRAWFGKLKKAVCRVRWTESPLSQYWEGELKRVVGFNRNTRTVTVAVWVKGEEAFSQGRGSLPLVEGMYCRVSIPGKTLEDVVRLPAWAVSFENRVRIVEDNRLKTVPVVVARLQDGFAFIKTGLSPGAMVVTTKLISPAENSLLSVEKRDEI